MHDNPFDSVVTAAGAYCVSRCLHVIARLGVADAVDETPKAPVELAQAVGAAPDALGRVLRLLAAHGIFQQQNGRFTHSPASRLLRSDHPQSMRPFVQMLGFDINWRSFEHFEDCVRTGLPSSSKVVPSGFWQYFAEHPEEGRIFDAAMTAKASGQIAAIVQAYDFTRFNLIADIGGGRGHLLRAVLEQAPNARGVLFDLPHVIEAAAGFAFDRLRLQAGDFFRDALPRADAYLLMEVIHDWDDEHSIAILSAIRRAAHKHAEVLLIETLVPDNSGPDWAKTLDIFMLSFLGGSQRTCKEYEALLAQSGFRIEREIATASNVSIIEAVCA